MEVKDVHLKLKNLMKDRMKKLIIFNAWMN
jgi:hypothetical protein